jgi:hypothetical protein
MHTTHVSSGGRYPVLRTLAILYLFAAAAVLVLGVWRAVSVLIGGTDADVFGATPNMASRWMAAFAWLAASFIGVLGMFAVAELIKLLIDIEHNTRLAGMRSMAGDVVATTTVPAPGVTAVVVTETATATADNGLRTSAGEGVAGGGRVRQLLEGEETAEGALLRGH